MSGNMTHLVWSAALVVLLAFPSLCAAQQALWPAAWPLVARSPYFNAWESTYNGTLGPADVWPATWDSLSSTTAPSLGWVGYVRVDGVPYRWLAQYPLGESAMNTTNALITPTRTTWTMPAGPMEINITFFDPIDPGNWTRQSMPFSYFYLDAASLDGQPHNVQVYSDVNARFTSGDPNANVEWETHADSFKVYHEATLAEQTPFQETATQADWGTLYLAMRLDQNARVTYKTGHDNDVREQFHVLGKLDLGEDTDFRAIHNNTPVFAIASDLGNITSTQGSPVVWAIGYDRDPAVGIDGTLNPSLYYRKEYSGIDTLLDDFLGDFASAKQRVDQLDAKILSDASSVSSGYTDVVSLATRQVFSATELILSNLSANADGEMRAWMFMKNIGGDNPRRMSPVEILYQSFPFFMYLNPKLGAPLLEPLLFAAYPQHASPDLGSSYPVVQRTEPAANQAIEQTANMLIMVCAHARATGNGNLAYQYYSVLHGWTDFLVQNTLYPTNQTSIDTGLFVSNQTNLAIKGIIAIKAMSQLVLALGKIDQSRQYAANASKLGDQWTSLAVSTDKQRLLATYDDPNSTTLGYNLFVDIWLGTNVVDRSIFDMQTSYFSAQLNSGNMPFGIPTDTSDTQHVNSAWNMFAAAMSTDISVRNSLISRVRARASFNQSLGAFPVTYEALSGQTTSGQASPAQGAMYAPLALLVSPTSITFSPSSSSSPVPPKHPPKHSHVGAIIGGVIGGVAAIGIFSAILLVRRKRLRLGGAFFRKKKGLGSIEDPHNHDSPDYRMPSYGPAWQANLVSGPSTDALLRPDPVAAPVVSFPLSKPDPAAVNMSGKELARYRADPSNLPVNRVDTAVTPSTTSRSSRVQSASGSVPPTSESSLTLADSRQAWHRLDSEPSARDQRLLTAGASDGPSQRVHSEVEDLRREIQQIRDRLEPPPDYFEQSLRGA